MKLDAIKIKLILVQKGMNQSDLACKCGVTRQQIYEILCKETCSLKTLGRIVNALGVSVVEIIKEGE